MINICSLEHKTTDDKEDGKNLKYPGLKVCGCVKNQVDCQGEWGYKIMWYQEGQGNSI